MNWGAVVLPLVLAALLLYILWYFVRAAGRALARSREVTRFRFEVKSLGAQVDPLLERLAARTDAARRHQLPPEELLDELTAGATALGEAQAGATSIRAPSYAAHLRDAMGQDIERATRALEMIHFGCEQAAAGRGRGSELEAQTAVKRGYLNLLHARESFGGHLAEATRLEPLPPPRARRSRI
ncbi:MAG: hypothetical protein ACXVAE_06540 [Candidatus Limnocylindrales bacterium]